MTLAEAVDLVARTILAEALWDPDRDDFSDADRALLAKRLMELAPYPDQDAYDEARAFLAARAEET
jgi:hypothetical protein